MVEIIAAGIIGMALIKVLYHYISVILIPSRLITREQIRVGFGRSVALALELLLGADVLATAVAPSWDDIGKLAAIAVLRTALNYFLEKELEKITPPAELPLTASVFQKNEKKPSSVDQ